MSRPAPQPGWLERAEALGRLVENTGLVLILAAMILLGAAQILLRNVAGGGLPWADEALRIMVLWLAMLGSVAASREERHISIDVLSRLLAGRWQQTAGAVICVFTATVCLVIAWYAWAFVSESREYGDQLLGDLPAWMFQAILPVAFLLMGYRYLVAAARRVLGLFRGVSG